MEYETAMALLSAQVGSSWLFHSTKRKKKPKTRLISTMMKEEASEGAGDCSVPFPEKAEVHALLPSGT